MPRRFDLALVPSSLVTNSTIAARKRFLAGTAVILVLGLGGLFVATRRSVKLQKSSLSSSAVVAGRQVQLTRAYGELPLSFERNQGQTDASVKFIARGSGYNLFLTPNEAVLDLSTPPRATSTSNNEISSHKPPTNVTANFGSRAVLRMKVLGANPEPAAAGQNELPGKANYFIGKESKNWKTGVSTFERVNYRHVYPGIDLTYYGNQGQLEYDFIVQPGRNPKQIAMGIEGADGVQISDAGELIIRVGDREVRQQKPFAYQEVNGVKNEIASRYQLVSDNQFGFELGDYDVTRPLVIDPVLVYSTYFGGTGFDTAPSIAVDSAGNAYLTGTTSSLNFPGSGVQKVAVDATDAFVAKLNAAGTAVLYSSYFGGDNWDFARGIAVDASGTAYVTGSTNSFNFPTAGSPFQSTKTGGNPLFKSTDGGNNFGSGVPGNSSSGLTTANVSSIAVHPTSPSIVFATPITGASVYKSVDGGATWSFSGTGLPDDFSNEIVFNRANPTIMYVAAAGTSLLGGGGGIYRSTDGGSSWLLTSVTGAMNTIISDGAGIIYAGGFDARGVWKSTDGVSWSNQPIGDVEADGAANGFGYSVTNIEVDPSNPAIIYVGTDGGGIWKSLDGGSTYSRVLNLPGYVSDHSLSIDTSNTVYAVVAGVLQKSSNGGASWSVVATPATAGSYPISTLIVGSTVYLGTSQNGAFTSTDGGANWSPTSLTANNVHGLAAAPSATNEIYAAVLSGSEGFVAKFNPDGASLAYSTYIGGGIAGQWLTADDNPVGIAIDSAGNAYIAGSTSSANFPVQNATQPANGGFFEAFVAKLNSTGSNLLFSTYVGGSGVEQGRAIALAANGDIYTTGNTPGGSFPLLNASQGTYGGGGNDAFIVKFAASGPNYTIAYSTYMGGPSNDQGRGLAVDSSGNVYVAGQTNSLSGIATAGAAQTARGANIDGFLVKLGPTGTKVYGTYIGGTSSLGTGQQSQDIAQNVVVDQNGNAYVTGSTRSNGFPVANSLKAFNSTTCLGLPCNDAFLTMFNSSGSTRVFSTLLGGDGEDQAFGIALDGNGGVYVSGFTSSTEALAGAPQSANAGGGDGFVTKLTTNNDLSITMSDSPDPVSVNTTLTYTITVSNSGERGLTGVSVSDALPADVTLVSATPSQGSCSGTTTVNCNIGNLNVAQSATVTLQVTPTIEGAITNTANAACNESETNSANNSATQNTRVTVGTVYTVNSNADTNDGACTATGTGNGCTLREALNAANANAGKDTILFSIGSGLQTITLTSSLPSLSQPVLLDATSQPGFAGQPNIEVNGTTGGTCLMVPPTSNGNTIRGLILNRCAGHGIQLDGNNNTIQGNYIGTNASGTATAPVTFSSIFVGGSNNLIGGPSAAHRNVLSGNGHQGIAMTGSGNTIQGNYIGTNAAGTAGLGGGSVFVFQGASNNMIGGSAGTTPGGACTGACNLISGNNGSVSINTFSGAGATNNTIQGNVIGLNAAGTATIPNNGAGVVLSGVSGNHVIGNVISGNTGDGIQIQSVVVNTVTTIATGNTVQGNLIGGSTPLRNGNNGINLNGARDNTIGGTGVGAGNTISFNFNNGVVVNCPTLNGVVTCGLGNAIQQNSIFSNNNIGIRFNAAGASVGHNNQAAPVVSFVSTTAGGTTAQGSLTSVANSQFTLEFFANDSCDPSSAGEGQTYIGSTQVTTDGTGNVSFSVATLNAVPVGKIITATATHATNGTSRFSTCLIASAPTASISGRATDQNGVPLSGAVVTLSGSQNATATTDSQGNYAFPNLPSSVSYTVAASLSGITFYPASFSMANLPSDRIVNFTKAVARYTITDLGALTAGPQSTGWDVNDAGQATGWSNSGPGSNTNYRPYFYNNGSLTNLSPLGTGTNALPISINDSARMVGFSELTPQTGPSAFGGQLHGFFSDNGGVLKDIGTFGGASSQAWGVNDNGVVVGQAQLSNGQTRPFVWRDLNSDGLWQQSEMIDLGAINNGTFGRAFAINNNNVAVGNSTDGATLTALGTLWKDDNGNGVSDPGELRNLGNLGGPNVNAQGINDSDFVVGLSEIVGIASNGRVMHRAFIWHDDNGNGVSDAGEMKNLGTLGGEFSAAIRINQANHIVGWSDAVGIFTAHAILYKNNFMLDLNAAIPQDSGWVLTEARGLSDNGKITGYGTVNGVQHAYLLTPSLASQTVTLDPIPNKTYGNAPFTVNATASSNLPVTYSVTGPATINGSTVTITGAGSVTITASQAGDGTYDSASASQTITVAKKSLSVTANGKTRLFGAPDPTFTASYFGFVNGDTSASLGGSLSFTTNANANSNIGSYAITPSGLSSDNYAFVYLDGTLTIDQASTSTASANYQLAAPGNVNLLAQVTADAPSTQPVNGGTVTFTIRQGATTVGSVTSGAVSNGQASASFNVSAGGAYTVYVTYGGSGNYFGSTSVASLTVGNANPVPSITGVNPDSTIKKATETGQFTLLIDGNGFISTANGDAANSTVDWYDRTTGQHTNLTITSTLASQIQAIVPFTLIRDGKTVEITVINPGPGGGSSNAQPFFITDTNATITSSETVLPDPVTGNASTTSVTPTGAVLSAEASSGGAGGTGAITVAQYSEDPIGTNTSPNTSAFSTAEGSGYFDVYVSPGSSFTTLTLDYCNTGGTTLYWWNGSVWGLVSNQTYNPTSGCITVAMTTTSSPSIAQLTGTVFGVASGPSVHSITVSPSATVALGSGPVTLTSSFTDALGGAPYDAEITWGDGAVTNLSNLTATTFSSPHTYAAAGTFDIKVKVSSGARFGSATFSSIVVFDPNAGSMKANGWFSSPLGAFPDNPGFAGKVHFNSNAKYDKQTNVLGGTLKLTLPGKEFNATSYAFLSITGSKFVTSGAGTVNGVGGYSFVLSGIDGKIDGKKLPDKIRVKIWNSATGQIVYDTQMEAPHSATAALALGGGQVNIQK